ncbi:GMC oxidoreductase [Aureobasidium pullulans]|nr:GMC oxidoreductase [Aureobasidium pullulans]
MPAMFDGPSPLIATMRATTLCLTSLAQVALASTLYSNSFGVPGLNATYDYVVVGGGTAGLTIAARLAEDPNISVAVIEAGGFYQQENGNGSVIPGLCTTQFTGSDPDDTQPLIDWGFTTTPQAGINNQISHYARGKTLGGSSARNYMAYHRGTNGSYGMWADQVGDESYRLSNLDQYFQRSINITAPNVNLRKTNATVNYKVKLNHAQDGYYHPLQHSWSNWVASISTWTYAAYRTLSLIPNAAGFESGDLDGYFYNPSTITPDTQHRSSSQTSFLDYAMRTTSIKVYTHALARQILFTHDKVANGVLVQSGSKNYTLSATKEVILSAGAFQSPQMLMVSGIGPRETLQKYGIPVIADLPGVGQNLQDQPTIGSVYRVNVPTSSKLVNDPEYAAEAAASYLANGTGIYAAPPGILAFERISESRPELLSNDTLLALKSIPDDWPQLEYLTQDGYVGTNRNYRTADPGDGYNYASISMVVVSQFSKGNVTISSADASVQPVINPNWLTAPEDFDLAIAGFKRTREIWSHINVTIGPEHLPGPNVTTDAQILDYIRDAAFTLYHASATCKMGRIDDKMAVVDSKARVYGVQGLRVVDASAFPFLPPGHPQATVYMLAEKIAEDIKRGY